MCKIFFTTFIFFIFFTGFTTNLQAIITVPLNGSYSVNADGSGDFISLKEAADTYNTYGLNGNSTLIIKSNLVETAMVEFKGTAPNSSTYYLTITTDNTVQRKVSGAINGSLVKLTGANNIIFDGIIPAIESAPAAPLLSFTNTYSTAGATVRTLSVEKDGASSGKYVRIQNVELTMANQQRGPGGGSVAYFSTDSLWINNSYIHNGYNAINGDANRFIRIQNNIISENHAAGITTLPFTSTVDITITHNIIKDMTPTSGSRQKLYGINVVHNAGDGTCDVSDNKIDNLNNQAGFECSTIVIYVYSAAAIKANRNKISNVYNNSVSTGFALQGMYLFANTTNPANTIQCLNDTVVNLNSESYAVAITATNNAGNISLVKNCVVSNISGKGLRPDLYNSIGIYVSGPVNLDANKVDNIKNTANIGQASAIGIYLNRLNLPTGFVSNNMVSDVAGKIGIGIAAVGTVNLYHNSVRLLSKFNASDEATLIDLGDRLSSANLSNIRIQNNLLSNEVSNGLSQNFLLKRQSAPGTSTTITNISNNRYYVANSNIAMVVSDGAAQTGTTYPTLSGWATASTDNSLMVLQPAFTAINNLHLIAFPYGLQVPLITGITTDFDGELRSSCGNTAGVDINPLGQGPLNGTYRIGNAPTDNFSSLKQAADIYNICGLAGNTTFMIVDDLTETATAEFKGTAPNSSTYYLTITTDNTVQRKVSGSINGTLVKLTGANNIIFDGIIPASESTPAASLLSFTNTYSTASAAVRTLSVEKDGASSGKYVRVQNVELTMANQQRGPGGGTVAYFSTDSLWLNNSYIHNGYNGIYGDANRFIQIQNNVISENHASGIYTLPVSTAVNISITHNIVKNMTPTSGVRQILYGIYVNQLSGGGTCDVSDNKIDNLNNQAGFECSTYGINVNTAAAIKANGNKLSNVYNNSVSTGFALQGIVVGATSGNAVQCLNDTVVNLNSESFAVALSVSSFSAIPSLVKNCVVSNISGKCLRPDFYNVIGLLPSGQINLDANKVDNIKNTASSAQASAIGIFLDRVNLSTGFVSNNMVSDVAGKIGIGISAVGIINLYHNSVRMSSKFNDSDEATLIDMGDRFSSANSSSIRVQNNLLSHEVTNGLSQNFVLKQQNNPGTSTIIINISNNRYYAANSNIAMVVSNRIAQTGTTYPTLTDWATASTDNSLMIFKPAFTAIDNLHLTTFSYGLQVPLIVGITTDFDGELRASCGNTVGADINPLGQGPLNGTYRIGNALTDDFGSLKQAADVYNSCGLSGNTTFMVVSDLTETATAEFKGSAPNSTLYSLTITTDNTVRRNVKGAIKESLVKFSGANNITINGIVSATESNPSASLLSFTNTYSTPSGTVRCLEIGLEAASHGQGVHILNSEFAMSQRVTSGGVVLNSLVNNLDVEGCYINTGYTGINSTTGNNIRIVNNIVSFAYLYGINATPLNPATLTVTGNVVNQMTATNPSIKMVGIRLNNSVSTGEWNILNNKVENLFNQNVTSTTIEGIYIDASADVQLNGNVVKNLTNNCTNAFFGVYGIYVVTRNSAKLGIANDTISTLNSSSFASGMYITHTNTAAYALIKNCQISDVQATGTRVDSYNAMGVVLSSAINMDAVSITNIKNSQGSASGIFLEGKSGGYVSNCMVSDVAGVVGMGLYVGSGDPGNFYHNTIRLTSKMDASHESTVVNLGSRHVNTGSTAFLQLWNNILSNEVSTGASKNFILKQQPKGAMQQADRSNNRYNITNGNVGMVVSDITTQAGTTYSTLSDWTAFSGDNSYIMIPAFVSPINLHLTAFPAIIGVPLITGFDKDFDGEPRAMCGNAAGADNDPSFNTVLNGVYTIGNQPSDDFNSLRQAADVYNTCGLSGNTSFIITSDLVETAVSEFKGTAPGSDTWTLNITSDGLQHKVSGNSNVLVQFTAANNIIIDGGVSADATQIDGGVNNTLLIFNNTSPGANTVALKVQPVSPTDQGKNIVISNATFTTASLTGDSKGVEISTNQSVINVSGCYLTNSTFGVNLLDVFSGEYDANVIRNVGKSAINLVNTSSPVMDLHITSNDIKGVRFSSGEALLSGISVLATGGTGNMFIDNNKISEIENLYSAGNADNIAARGIRVDFSGNLSCLGDTIMDVENVYGSQTQGILLNVYGQGIFNVNSCSIDNIKGAKEVAGIVTNTHSANANYTINSCEINQIESTGSTANQFSSGIYADGAGTISGNKIGNVISNDYYGFGIRTQWTSGNNTDYLLMANNMIHDIKAKFGYGVFADQSLLKQKIFQNTISLSGLGVANTSTINIGFGRTSANDLRIWNNILVNTDVTGTALLFDGDEVNVGDNVFLDNKYKVSSGMIGALAAATYNSLSSWSGVSGDNSVMADPVFVSASDLHLTGSSLTDGILMSPYLTEVSVDIDGDSRAYCKNTAGVDNTDMEFSVTNATLVNATSPGGNITITANEFGGKAPYKYSLNGGANYYDVTSVANNVITIVTASPVDGTYYLTIKDYNNCVVTAAQPLVVHNPTQNSDAKLKDLQVDGVTIEGFNPDKISYMITLPCEKEQVSLLGIPNDPEATVSGNGTFPLEPGDNYFAITVTAKDMVTTMTYTVNVIRDCYVPRIIKDLEDAIVCIGGTHTWSIEVEGQNLTYEWYCGFNRIIGANTNSITISDAKLTDYERYYVVIRSNYNGFKASKFSKRVKLWVADYLPAQLKLSDYPNPATAGKTYHVQVDGYQDVTKYSWSYSKEGVTFSPEIGKETENETWATFGTLAVGTGTLKVTMDHPCGTREVTQSITVQHPTGVDEVFNDLNAIKVFPNPTSGVIKVLNTEANQLIRITDVTGSLKGTCKTQEGTTTIDLTGYAKGTYVVQYNGKAYKVIRK